MSDSVIAVSFGPYKQKHLIYPHLKQQSCYFP